MKTNNITGRFGALILIGSIAAFTASAAETTPVADKPATDTTPAATAAPATDKPAWKYHHRHHGHHRHHCPFSRPGGDTGGTSSAWGGHVWLGALAEDSHARGHGHDSAPLVRLTRVFHHGPAHDAGLRDGDVIWKFDGSRLWCAEQLRYELRHEGQGAIIPLEIFRDGRREELKLKLGAPHTGNAERSGT